MISVLIMMRGTNMGKRPLVGLSGLEVTGGVW